MLKDRIAIVTGGGRGIGRAIAVAMAQEGAKVAVASRTRSELEQTVSIIADKGGHAIAVKADISDMGDVTNLVKNVEARFGHADILFNNAGVVGPVGELKDVRLEDFERCMDINFHGALLMARAVIPGMIDKKRGKIINVTTGLGELVMPRLGAYSLSKSAMIHFTRILAKELEAYNIQVNGLDPGTVDTRMHEELRGMDIKTLGPDAYRLFWGLKEGGYLKDPSEVAPLAVFLASEKSEEITGEVGTDGHYMQLGFRMAA